MHSGEEETWDMLERCFHNEVPLEEFERWLYKHPEAEGVIGAPCYLELVAADYRQPHAHYELSKRIHAIYQRTRPGCLPRDRARRLAKGLLEGTVAFRWAVDALAHLRNNGNEWVPLEFVGIASEFDDLPSPEQYPLWEPSALEIRLRDLEERGKVWREQAAAAAQELLCADNGCYGA